MSITYNALITPSHIFLDDGGVFSANKSERLRSLISSLMTPR